MKNIFKIPSKGLKTFFLTISQTARNLNKIFSRVDINLSMNWLYHIAHLLGYLILGARFNLLKNRHYPVNIWNKPCCISLYHCYFRNSAHREYAAIAYWEVSEVWKIMAEFMYCFPKMPHLSNKVILVINRGYQT